MTRNRKQKCPARGSVIGAVLFLAFILGPAPAFSQQPAEPQQPAVQAAQQQENANSAPQGLAEPQPIKPIKKEGTEKPAEPEAHGTRLRWQDIPRNILHDEKAIWTSPLHINRDNARWWLLFGGGAAALIATDRKTSSGLPNTSAQLKVSKWSSRLGSDYFIYPLTTTFYFAGKLGENPRSRDTARLGVEALADAEIAVNIIKLATQRARPTESDGHGRFWDGGDSFPSGHSIKSWALARVVAREFSGPKFVPILAYGLASTVSVSRFAARRHFASDALVGAAMGWFIGDYVYRKHHAPSEKSTVVSWLSTHADLQFNGRRAAIGVTLHP